MSLETGNWISDLNSSNPLGSDAKSQGDDHLRLVKTVLKNHFPNAATSSGTNIITLTLTPTMPEYKEGVLVVFKAGGTNTGATTININTLGAIDVQQNGGALKPGAITSGCVYIGVIRNVVGIKTLQILNTTPSPNFSTLDVVGVATFAGAVSLLSTFQLPQGTVPGVPANGHVWVTSSGLFIYFNGAQKQLLVTDGSGANLTALNASQLTSGTIPDARLSASLAALSALVGSADQIAYFNGVSTMALTPLTSFARQLIDDPSADFARATLELGDAALHDATSASGDLLSYVGSFPVGQFIAVSGSGLVGPSGLSSSSFLLAASYGNIENKSSATIRSELTSLNVTTALGYTPQNAATAFSGAYSALTGKPVRTLTGPQNYTGGDTTYIFNHSLGLDVKVPTRIIAVCTSTANGYSSGDCLAINDANYGEPAGETSGWSLVNKSGGNITHLKVKGSILILNSNTFALEDMGATGNWQLYVEHITGL